MEVLAGVAAVLVPAVAILVDLTRPTRAELPGAAPPTSRNVQLLAPAVDHQVEVELVPQGDVAPPVSLARVLTALDALHDGEPPAPPVDAVAEPDEPAADEPAPAHADSLESIEAEPAATVAPEPTPRLEQPGDEGSDRAPIVVRGHAPTFAPAPTPTTVTVRVVPPTAARPRPGTAAERSTRHETSSAPRAAASASVLGVFSDTEPDRGTAAMRRTTSALVLAVVTVVVATGVGGAIYLGLSRLG